MVGGRPVLLVVSPMTCKGFIVSTIEHVNRYPPAIRHGDIRHQTYPFAIRHGDPGSIRQRLSYSSSLSTRYLVP